MKAMNKLFAAIVAAAVVISGAAFAADTPKKVYTFAWSHYIGWEPIALMAKNGTLARHAAKNGVEIKVTEAMDYIESVTQFAGGAFHALAVTNMDALIGPGFGGVDTEVIIVGDYSNGNDGVVLKGAKTCADAQGRNLRMVEHTVSEYLAHRMAEVCKFPVKNLKVSDVAEANIVSAFLGDKSAKAAVVTWNPYLAEVRNAKGATMVFNSSQIPGEIIDMIVVRKDAPDALKKAIVGAWYETLGALENGGPARTKAVAFFAESMGQTVAQAEAQLKTTALFTKPTDAVAFTEDAKLKETMERVRSFVAATDLYKGGNKDVVGIQFPDGTVMGDPKNVKVRFSTTYMRAVSPK